MGDGKDRDSSNCKAGASEQARQSKGNGHGAYNLEVVGKQFWARL